MKDWSEDKVFLVCGAAVLVITFLGMVVVEALKMLYPNGLPQ